jgi:hypothetical protein
MNEEQDCFWHWSEIMSFQCMAVDMIHITLACSIVLVLEHWWCVMDLRCVSWLNSSQEQLRGT